MKQVFGIFSPIYELAKNIPKILLLKTLMPDSKNCLLKDGKIVRRKMRKKIPSWVSPTNFNDPDSKWTNEGNAYDDDASTYAGSAFIASKSWGKYIELTISATTCDRVRISANHSTSFISKVSADVYYGAAWHNIYEGVFNDLKWTILRMDTLQSITKMRLKFYNNGTSSYPAFLYEAHFGKEAQIPDNNPILHYHTFTKRLTGSQYLLAFTKAHIYCWDWTEKEWVVKFTCSADCENWEVKSYNDKVVCTNNVDPVLVWGTTGYFMPLQNTVTKAITETFTLSPCKITIVGHGYSTGDRVWIEDVGGMTEINNIHFVITKVDADNFTLDGINATGYTDYTSGGTCVKWEGIEYSRDYDTETEVDETSAKDQKVLKVEDTTDFAVGDKVIIGRGTEREEVGIISSVQTDESLTFEGNLIYEHTADIVTHVDENPADLQIENCDDAWNESVDGDVVSTADTVDKQEGSASAKLVVAAAVSAGDLLATEVISSTDISLYGAIRLHIKCSIATNYGDLQLLLDNTASCASPLKLLNIPPLIADEWTEIDLPLGNASKLTALVSIGLKYVTDIGECDIHLDDIRGLNGKVLKVASTEDYEEGEIVTIDKDGDKEETKKIDSIQDGISLTMTKNLLYAHHPVDIQIENCDDTWAESVDEHVTSEIDTGDKKEGTASIKLTVADAVSANDILATEVITDTDLSDYSFIRLWIKSSIITSAGDLQLLLDDSANCASPIKSLDIPALAVDTWTQVDLDLGDASGLTAVVSIGLRYVTDLGACIIRVDDVRAFKLGDEVIGSSGQNDKVEEYESYFLTKVKYLTIYENFIILGYTYENGNYYPQRFRWNAIGEETNWVTGNSGSTEVGKSDFLKGFGKYQGLLIVFKAKSHYKYWLTPTKYVFNGAFISMTIGCRCSKSIVNDSKGRLYWYASDGTFKEISKGTISQPIQTDIVDKIYQSSVEKMRSEFIDETEEICWAVPIDNILNNLLLTFKEGKWGQVEMALTAMGGYREP